MIFTDRYQAGKELVSYLTKYQNLKDCIVIGLPRGGVVTAFEVAQGLHLPLEIVCPRKIGAPFNPELAIGAITETGEGIFDQSLISRLNVSEDYIQRTVEVEKKQAQRRLSVYRQNRPPRNLKEKIVILVDDGLATGSTMKAAIKTVQAEGAEKIIVAVPVSPPDTLEEIRSEVDEVVCIKAPPFFSAVGEFYENFNSTEDDEVIDLLNRSEKTAKTF